MESAFFADAPLRAMVAGRAIPLPAVAGWTFTNVAIADIEPNRGASCVIVNFADDIASFDMRTLSQQDLPLVAFVTGRSSETGADLDLFNAFMLEGDDPATIRRVLDTVVARRGGFAMRDLSDGTARTIGELGAEASRIAAALQSLAARQSTVEPQPLTAATVRRIIRARRDRDRFLPAMLFADPAWDMLLDLAAARLEGREVPVSSLCIAAEVPTTTALRWIRTLTEAGLFERHSDPGDARRNFVRLTDTAAEAMFAWLRQFTTAWVAR